MLNYLYRNIKNNLFEYILVILSVSIFIKMFDYSPNNPFSGVLLILSIIFLIFSILIYIIKKIGFTMKKKDILYIIIIPIIVISCQIYRNIIKYQSWHDQPIFILMGILILGLFIIIPILIGLLIYYIFSHPKIILFFLLITNKIIKFWYFIQLKENPRKFKFTINTKDHKYSHFRLLMHFFFELFFIYMLLTLASIPNKETFLSILGPKDFLWENKLFIIFLPIYALIFSLHFNNFKYDNKIIKTSLFHKFLSVTALLVVVYRIYNHELEFEVILHTILIYILFIFGISCAFLILHDYSVNRIDRYFSFDMKYKFLDINKDT